MSTPEVAPSLRPSPEDFGPRFDSAVAGLASAIARLDPGPAAQLRRGPFAEAGAPAFWRLLTRCELDRLAADPEGWAAVIQGMAILTPRGGDRARPSAHDPATPAGRALAAAGFSELRLARLLSTPGATRRDLAHRACRMLARYGARIDWRQMARLILFGDQGTLRRVAADYYTALDRAARDTESTPD